MSYISVVLPEHTPSPPSYRGEATLWTKLRALDDGNLHLWFNVGLKWDLSLDLLVQVPTVGTFCIDVNILPLSHITNLELKLLNRKDGGVSLSPFGQAINNAKELGASLDSEWDQRPDLVPAVAFPNISREEWTERFEGSPLADLACRCILKNDLENLASLKSTLQNIVNHPIDGKIHNGPSANAPLDPYKLDQTLHVLGRIKAPVIEIQDDPVTSLLDEAIGLVKGPGNAYGAPGFESLGLWRAALDNRTTRLRVTVVGEFKSGKSTLINAILGREVCFVDEFEATTMSATYTQGAEESVSVLNQENIVEEWTLETFLERSAKRDLVGIRRIVVSLPTDLPFDLVDSPGLGSSTEGRSEEAEREIRWSDLVLWTVDCNDPGSARENAFLQRAREIGLPILVLLTKSEVLDESEVQSLIDYVAEESGTPRNDILAVSAHGHMNGTSTSVSDLVIRLRSASKLGTAFQERAYKAKVVEAIDGSMTTVRFLVEINSANARFVAAERGYLETSALGISVAARLEWLRVLREECAEVAKSIAQMPILNPTLVEHMLQEALPDAVTSATNKFLKSLRRLVRDEWRGALEERSREFEKQLAEVLNSRPDAHTDIEFLRSQSEAFRTRADIVAAETEPINFDNRLLIMGLGAAASFVTVSMLPIAVAGVVAVVAARAKAPTSAPLSGVDLVISDQIEDALLSSFETVSEDFERAIDRIVSEVAARSLVILVKRRKGPDLETILMIERKGWDLLDELAATRRC